MAKRKPTLTLTLVEMERILGYDFRSLTQPVDALRRFYSDLKPVADSAYERIKREFEKYQSTVNSKHNEVFPKKLLRELDKRQVISHGQNRIILTQRGGIGFYRFVVDIHYGCGLYLPLLFSEDEACRTLSVAKLQPSGTRAATAMVCKLPKEIRDHIYTFALCNGDWSIQDVGSFHKSNLTSGIGDPGGFYFPLSKVLGILRVNHQMRQEALPLAYRMTTFRLDDMDDLLKLLIAVGEIGRDNIEVLSFPWQSRSGLEFKWEENPDSDDHFLTLPNLHVMKCVQLLKQCKRLRLLRLYFESDLIENIAPGIFKADSGILELRSIHIGEVEVWSLGHESLEHSPLIHWLKKGMGCSRRSEGKEGMT